eukprot:TRINITY_DN7445_c0_g1_i2.p1 TRINITY_DN7445_c0_g1~~TRINITY_DN7445_c0_g1_i2.p1  ORF type:complete len:275 (+),score=33.05 TRINITY_DN7445_c0_g1_i2:68-826(+)
MSRLAPLILLFWSVRLVTADFLEAHPAEAELLPELQLTRTCSRTVSARVRQRLQEEVWQSMADGDWQAGCPFDPSRDLYGKIGAQRVANKSMSEWDGVCLADYCDIFDVCEEAAPKSANCEPAEIAIVKRRCETAVSSCFPLSGSELSRRLHTRMSQQRCRVLDCRFRDETLDLSSESAVPAAVILMAEVLGIGAVCALLFGLVISGVETSGDGLVSLVASSGLVSRGFVKGCVRAREGMRATLTGERTKHF